ncbi:MAG: hypothetical protein ACTSYI_08000 [Promethearchaeota archaeon]
MAPEPTSSDSTQSETSQEEPKKDSNNIPILIFDRIDKFSHTMPKLKFKIIKAFLERFVLGIVVSRYTGEVLYNFQVDHQIRVHNMSKFIAALSIFGEENVGSIKRIFIDGLDIEMRIIHRNRLVLTTFFRPNRVVNKFLSQADEGLDQFYSKFKEQLEAGISDQKIYQTFDEEIFQIILKNATIWNIAMKRNPKPTSDPPTPSKSDKIN